MIENNNNNNDYNILNELEALIPNFQNRELFNRCTRVYNLVISGKLEGAEKILNPQMLQKLGHFYLHQLCDLYNNFFNLESLIYKRFLTIINNTPQIFNEMVNDGEAIGKSLQDFFDCINNTHDHLLNEFPNDPSNGNNIYKLIGIIAQLLTSAALQTVPTAINVIRQLKFTIHMNNGESMNEIALRQLSGSTAASLVNASMEDDNASKTRQHTGVPFDESKTLSVLSKANDIKPGIPSAVLDACRLSQAEINMKIDNGKMSKQEGQRLINGMNYFIQTTYFMSDANINKNTASMKDYPYYREVNSRPQNQRWARLMQNVEYFQTYTDTNGNQQKITFFVNGKVTDLMTEMTKHLNESKDPNMSGSIQRRSFGAQYERSVSLADILLALGVSKNEIPRKAYKIFIEKCICPSNWIGTFIFCDVLWTVYKNSLNFIGDQTQKGSAKRQNVNTISSVCKDQIIQHLLNFKKHHVENYLVLLTVIKFYETWIRSFDSMNNTKLPKVLEYLKNNPIQIPIYQLILNIEDHDFQI